jgi:two-component system, cell cycle response regulator
MSARILVVDDIDSNVRLLEAKLRHEYFEVLTASRGEEALIKVHRDQPDLVLLDVMMPGMDGFEVCRRLKDDPATRFIPIVMLTALDQREDRIRGLAAGADDFLTKPFNDVSLMARVRSLTRLKVSIDELRSREARGRDLGVIEGALSRDTGLGARCLVIDDNIRQSERVLRILSRDHRPVLSTGSPGAAGQAPPEVLIVSLVSKGFDGLAVLAHIRQRDTTRHLPVLAIVDEDEPKRALRALELGVNDIVYRPIDPDELNARVRTLAKRKRYTDALRQAVDSTMELAVTDQLTGLNNRRFLMSQLKPMIQRAARGGTPVSVLVLDIDHFKRVNDSFGHDAGDDVLRVFARRLSDSLRPGDIPARFGGEEFVVAMPGTAGDAACMVAERVRRTVAALPILTGHGRVPIDVTVSIGVATVTGAEDSIEALLKRADEAVYAAKQSGRNRVIAHAA